MFCIPEGVYGGSFGQEQVPLTDEIKEILEEYPDGQIFKVCKQLIARYAKPSTQVTYMKYKIIR